MTRPCRVIPRRSLCLMLALMSAASSADDARFELRLPVDCAIGGVCTLQNYFDHDPGSGFRDYRCGSRGYDGHDGTDIRVPNLAIMRDGVAVVAAAPGRVRAIRDAMPDVSVREIARQDIEGREAGNAVAIDHGKGWETQYSHLRRGSLRVGPGDLVAAGQVIGLIGMSGNAEFPHLHFEVRHAGVPLDPFVGPDGSGRCGEDGTPLWNAAALGLLDYPPAGLLQAGFATEAPTSKSVLEGAYTASVLPAIAPNLVFWIESFGVQQGDREILRITGPDGAVLVEQTDTVPGNKARWLRFIGKQRRAEAWPPGSYQGHYRLERESDGQRQPVLEIERSLSVQ